jgi:hypothetical protein
LLSPFAAHAQTGRSVIKKWFGLVCSPQGGTYKVTRLLPIFFFFLLSSSCFGQSWSNILSSSRAIDWTKAGLPPTLPDGETTPNPWTPPTRTQCVTTACNTVSGGAVTATSINAALASAPQGTYVLIPSGNFTISSATITMYNQNGVTLRGSGPQSTTLTLTGSSQIQMGAGFGSGSCTWVSGFAAGSTTLTMNGCSGPAPAAGELFSLNQCDSGFSGAGCTNGSSIDNGGLYVCGLTPACQRPGQGTGNLPEQQQVVYVTSVTGGPTYTVNFTPGLYMPNWSSANSPTVNWQQGAHTVSPYGNALENMTIYSIGLSSNWPVNFNANYASWIKGVRFLNVGDSSPPYTVVNLNSGKNCLVANNYFFSDTGINANYPPAMQEGGDSDSLVINNIMVSGIPWEGTGSHEGDVFAYNYTRDNFTAYVLDIFEHNAGNAFQLYEGNQTPSIQEDDTHGTHDLSTIFRNYISGWEEPYVSSNFAGINLDAFDRFANSVGNAIGSLKVTNYQAVFASSLPNYVYSLSATSSAHSDPLVQASVLRWGNYDTATNTTRFQASEIPTTLTGNAAPFNNLVPSSTNLPCSFFLATYTSTTCTAHPSGGTGLSWWKVCMNWTTFPTNCATSATPTFPPNGPDVTGGPYVSGHAYDNPAAVAFKNLPIDSNYQKSYTISASIWASGIETLTITGLPNTTHLLGPFQVSGGACSTGAGEVYMTTSTTATISYALASNPGNCVGGTFKFPDVRQFDERAYQADTGSTTKPTPSSNLIATTQ